MNHDNTINDDAKEIWKILREIAADNRESKVKFAELRESLKQTAEQIKKTMNN
ncbi:MAG: hypothetical protein HQL94_09140 [Magnetococcales bacterium]|nr:hypothetical protein [Magnetococcales bacterium]